MASETIFRAILLIGCITVLPLALRCRLRARTGENLDRRAEGWLILLTLRPLGAATMIGLLSYLINPRWMAWSSMPVPEWLRWLGAAIGGGAGVLLITAMHHLGPNLTDTVVTRNQHTLVTGGPYRYVRHPIYVGWLVLIWATPTMTVSHLLFALATTAYILSAIPMEEKDLETLLPEYEDYKKTTPALIPGTSGKNARPAPLA